MINYFTVPKRLETLTQDPKLLKRAKLALKAVHEWNTDPNFKYNPHPSDISDKVAHIMSNNVSINDVEDLDLDALNREREMVRKLDVIGFLIHNGYIQHLCFQAYWVPPNVAEYCPKLYE